MKVTFAAGKAFRQIRNRTIARESAAPDYSERSPSGKRSGGAQAIDFTGTISQVR